jgi:hypothetical protein
LSVKFFLLSPQAVKNKVNALTVNYLIIAWIFKMSSEICVNIQAFSSFFRSMAKTRQNGEKQAVYSEKA